ncbi:isoprenyl transferase [Methylonatrum kenyense]|uniref:isoprenyl transferase n=1 Tax=Methylonatrum kenyense TaxID=455253 RepID=UPI0020BD8FEB|nr:isoprenyl transferase [Methylonatrum kenyense]MCK8516376.1 isoprenyl transferase [Methylonatrum kenyense]
MKDHQPTGEAARLPRHIAVVMDGNGRWAEQRRMPRTAGHRAGVKAARTLIESCGRRGVHALTLFAFSSENWRRPKQEVSTLLDLMLRTLRKEASKLHENNVRIRVIGDRDRLGGTLCHQIERVEALTADNTGLQLVVAVSYGGRWDITRACQRLASRVADGSLDAEDIDEGMLNDGVALAGLPGPDLLIRTGGECRLSNFLLWQLAYAELYFTDVLWPDFTEAHLDRALTWFAGRERRFGGVPAMLDGTAGRA